MVYIITHSKYPSHLGSAVAKRYLEVLPKFPPDPSLGEASVPIAGRRTEKGYEVITVTDVPKGKLEAAMERIHNQLAMFNDIDGFEISLDVYMDATESLKSIGMKLPE